MGRRLHGQWYLTADMSATIPTITQKFKFTDSVVIKAIRALVIAYGNPAFTALSAEIWDDQGGYPSVLKATSTNSRTKLQLMTDLNAFKSTYFDFASPTLRAGSYYHLALRASAYTGTASTHLAWAKHANSLEVMFGTNRAFWMAPITGKL